MNKCFLSAAALLVLGTNAAFAHITLEIQEAPVGSTYKAVLRVPHGCDGKATTAVRVQIPEGVIAVKPMPKSGWTLQTKKGKYEKSYQLYGQAVSDGVKEVDWSGGPLPDKTRQEFEIETFLTDSLKPGSTLYFPTVQECEQGVSRWIEIAPDGASPAQESRWPAPGVKLMKP